MRKLELVPNAIRLHCDFKDNYIAKAIDGRSWNGRAKKWEYPLNGESYQGLVENFPGIQVDPKITQAVQALAEREATVKQAKLQGWEGVEPTEPMPIKTKPFAHQKLGFELACKILGVFKDE